MDSVTNKMNELIKEKHEAIALAKELEKLTAGYDEESEKFEREIKKIEKQIDRDEQALDQAITDYAEAVEQLESQDKVASDAELMVAGLVRKVQLLEEESVRVNERLRDVLNRLEQCEKEYEEHEKVRKTLEMKAIEEDEQIEIQEAQVAEAIMLAEEADRKFEEMSRKLRMVENDYERMMDKAEDLEKKCSDWETDIAETGKKLKDMEVITARNHNSEEDYEAQLNKINEELASIEATADFSERTVEKLEKTVDQLDDNLYNEKYMFQMLSKRIDAMLNDMSVIHNMTKGGEGEAPAGEIETDARNDD